MVTSWAGTVPFVLAFMSEKLKPAMMLRSTFRPNRRMLLPIWTSHPAAVPLLFLTLAPRVVAL